MARIGRPTKFEVTAEIKERIVDILTIGMSLAEALIMTGVPKDALAYARKLDSDFSSRVKGAHLVGKERHIRKVEQGLSGWQASAWFLERKWGAEFGNRLKIDQKNRVAVKLTVVTAALTASPADEDVEPIHRINGAPIGLPSE